MNESNITKELIKLAKELLAKEELKTRNWKFSELEYMLIEIIGRFRGSVTEKRLLTILSENYGGVPPKAQLNKALKSLIKSRHITETKRGWNR